MNKEDTKGEIKEEVCLAGSRDAEQTPTIFSMILNPFLIKDSVLQSMQSILKLFNSEELAKNEQEGLEIGWTWILSATEQKINENEKESKEELTNLRRLTNNISLRPQILQTMQTNFSKIDIDVRKRLITSRLDSNNRLKLLKDYTEKVNKEWLTSLLTIINYANMSNQIASGTKTINVPPAPGIGDRGREKNIKNSWYENRYEKNICGEIISLAHQASHSTEKNGLTYRSMGDIFWIIYISLSKVLVQTLNRPLYLIESNILLNTIMESNNIFITLWANITKIKGNISEREGKLPIKWNKEVLIESQRLESIKKKGTDAKYLDGPADKLRQKAYFKFFPSPGSSGGEKDSILEKLIKPDEFKKRTLFLSNNLSFRVKNHQGSTISLTTQRNQKPPVESTKRNPSEAFRLASALLSQRFCARTPQQ